MINNITVNTINDVLKKDISVLYKDGPVDSRIMEELAYCKFYFPDVFSQYEQEVLQSIVKGISEKHNKKYKII